MKAYYCFDDSGRLAVKIGHYRCLVPAIDNNHPGGVNGRIVPLWTRFHDRRDMFVSTGIDEEVKRNARFLR